MTELVVGRWANFVAGGILLGIFSNSAFASPAMTLKPEASFSEMILLSIDKQTSHAQLLTWPADHKKSRLLSEFQIAMGKAEGDKVKEGDNKTPEGFYLAQRHRDGSSIPKERYGPHAIPLNFPNVFDKKEGKTGHGIWLHGAGNDERIAQKNVTEGCIAFYNSDILRLSSWLEPYQGLVLISNDAKKVNIERDLKEIKEVTLAWAEAWKNADIDAYISFYAKDFKLKGRNLKAYKRYKKRVFKSYKKMVVGISDLRVVSHPKYGVAMMNQDFNGDNRFISNGRKILFWEKNEKNQWKITRESFENQRFRGVSFSDSDIAKLEKHHKILMPPKGSKIGLNMTGSKS